MKTPMLSVIIPTYNERDNMPLIIPRLSRVLDDGGIDHEILVMDDDSPDGTCAEVRRLSKEYPKARCILRKKDRGLSQAVIEGFSRAKGDIHLVMDADLSHPVDAVPEMYRAIAEEGADVSVGSRHAKGGGIENWPAKRKFISFAASLMARPLTRCSDPMSGFFAIRPSVIEGAPLKAKGYKILLEVLVKGKYEKIREVPIVFRDREVGQSKLGSKVIMNYLQHLLALYVFPGSAPFFKFLFVGGTGMVIDLGVLTLMLSLLGTGYTNFMISQSVSFGAAVTWNFFWNRFWTFNARAGSASKQYLRFFVVASFAFAVRFILNYIGVDVFGIDEQPYYQLLTLGVIVVVTVINYLGSKLWAFKK
ncbi:MAG: glycosyltransferase family 2 protein [Candidatus Thermoplasmatota archaeon]|nr:glycosyltransferase family 2 protein [Candidatus Thermoplasmatota archaeon]